MGSMKFMFAHYEGNDPAGALKGALDSFTTDDQPLALEANGRTDFEAWNQWAGSNKKSFDSSSLGAKSEHNEYLRNRLQAAWQAGVEYGRATRNQGAADAGGER